MNYIFSEQELVILVATYKIFRANSFLPSTSPLENLLPYTCNINLFVIHWRWKKITKNFIFYVCHHEHCLLIVNLTITFHLFEMIVLLEISVIFTHGEFISLGNIFFESEKVTPLSIGRKKIMGNSRSLSVIKYPDLWTKICDDRK